MFIARWLHGAAILFILGLQKQGWEQRVLLLPALDCQFSCKRGSATLSEFHLLPPPVGIARKKFGWRNEFFSRSASAASHRRLPLVPAAVEPRVPSSKRWPSSSRATCANRGVCGSSITPAWKKCRSQ